MKRTLAVLVTLTAACAAPDGAAPPTTIEPAPTTAAGPTTAAPSPSGVLSEQLSAWSSLGIADYDLEYVLVRADGGDDSGTYRALVRDGEAVNCYVDEVLSMRLECDPNHFTVESIFDRIVRGDARTATVEYDERWHFPASVTHALVRRPYTLQVVSFERREPIDWVAYVDSGVDWMEAAYQGDRDIDWEEVRATARRLVLANPRRTNAYLGLEDAAIAVRGRFATPRSVAGEAHGEVFFEAVTGEGPTGTRLDGGIGYLSLPGTYANHVATYAAAVHEIMAGIEADPVCGWVVDLREHAIEDLARELLALGPLLGTGPLLSFARPDGESSWSYDGETVLVDGIPIIERYSLHGDAAAGLVVEGGGYTARSADAPIAVLTSSHNGGWILAAFVGRPATMRFGELAGRADPIRFPEPATLTFALPLGAVLEIPRPFEVRDRLGDIVDERPDETVLAVPDSGTDEILEAALAWLGSRQPCAAEPDG